MALKSDAVFDKIKVRLTKINPNEREIEHVYKCKIMKDGKVVKTWMMDLKAVKLYLGDDAADCTLICEDDVFVELATNKLTPKEAVDQGKLKVEGEMSFALKLLPHIASVQEC